MHRLSDKAHRYERFYAPNQTLEVHRNDRPLQTRDEIHKNDIYMELPNAQIKKLISVVDFRKSIPVPDGSFFEIDIRKHKDRDLLAKEYAFCASKKETIISKTKSVIRYQKRTGDILFAYCNFNLLETKMLEWK